MARECREPRSPIICYRCGKEGHIASRCDQGMVEGELLRRKLPPWSSEGPIKLPTSNRYSGEEEGNQSPRGYRLLNNCIGLWNSWRI